MSQTDKTTEEVPPQKQREEYKKVGLKSQQVGEIWYPISLKWYKAWIEYTAFNKKDEDVEEGIENLHLRDVPKPEAIDNSELVDADDPLQLKKELEEHLTHEWLHADQWKLLHTWYGGGPEFPRKVYERGTTYSREKYINMYPKFLRFAEVNSEGNYDKTKLTVEKFPEQSTLLEVVTKLEGGKENEEKEEPTVHLWLPFEHMKAIYRVSTGRGVNVTDDDLKTEDPNRYVEIPDDHLKTCLNDIALPKDVVILVERKRTTSSSTTKTTFPWPLVKGPDKWKQFQSGDILDAQDGQKKWYEAYIRLVGAEGTANAGKAAVHFIGWSDRWDEWVPIGGFERFALRHTHSKGKPYRPQQGKKSSGTGSSYSSSWYQEGHEKGKPEQKGVVGLRNLGNTCFMNSTIQCLAQSPYLTQYFLNGDFVHHINKNNPLGWKGKVAQAWAQLLKDMFSNEYKVLAPRDFKAAIGEVAPRFLGYSQQDSQELLSFLLDGLHEDLNQIQQKPGTESVESNGRPDEVVAAEAWRTYLKRNVSIIVDLLQGQYKSRVECPDCDRVSITFDPYMFLSVPLPTERYKTFEFTWIGTDSSIVPTVYGIKMLKVADISMLKKSIGKQFNVPSDDIFVCDVWKNKIHRDLKNRDMIAEINRRNDDIVVYYVPKPTSTNDKTSVSTSTSTSTSTNNNEQKKKDVQETNNNTTVNNNNSNNNNNNNNNNNSDTSTTTTNSSTTTTNTTNTTNTTTNGTANNNKQAQQSLPDFKTFQVLSQARVKIRTTSFFYSAQYREEDEPIGIPLLLTLPLTRPVTSKEARQKLLDLVRPLLTSKDKAKLTKEKTLPFSIYCLYGNNTTVQLEEKDDTVPLTERGFRFLLHFSDRTAYNEEACIREKRRRNESAPPPLGRNNNKGGDEDDDRSSSKPVMLSSCISAFTEEEILDENDAWYCSKCNGFKCAKKKIDLWSSPDLLIIHLKRFSYTRQWRDRINTLVTFPLEGLDMSPWIVADEHKRDALYDLYGISNHMGGMGGGHYTAFAKSLTNGKWYHLDDSRATEVKNLDSMVSSSAYVLYYKRKHPRELKQRASRVVIPNIDLITADKRENSPDQP